jgi:Protein kinase domain
MRPNTNFCLFARRLLKVMRYHFKKDKDLTRQLRVLLREEERRVAAKTPGGRVVTPQRSNYSGDPVDGPQNSLPSIHERDTDEDEDSDVDGDDDVANVLEEKLALAKKATRVKAKSGSRRELNKRDDEQAAATAAQSSSSSTTARRKKRRERRRKNNVEGKDDDALDDDDGNGDDCGDDGDDDDDDQVPAKSSASCSSLSHLGEPRHSMLSLSVNESGSSPKYSLLLGARSPGVDARRGGSRSSRTRSKSGIHGSFDSFAMSARAASSVPSGTGMTITGEWSVRNSEQSQSMLRFVTDPEVQVESQLEELRRLFIHEDPEKRLVNRTPLGKGGFGDVFIARDTKRGKRVAVKVLRKEYPENERGMAPEITTLARCKHPAIVEFCEVFLWQGIVSMSMEYCDAGTLRQLVEKTRLQERLIALICRRMLEGIDYLHRTIGMIHRDIKGSSMFRKKAQTPKGMRHTNHVFLARYFAQFEWRRQDCRSWLGSISFDRWRIDGWLALLDGARGAQGTSLLHGHGHLVVWRRRLRNAAARASMGPVSLAQGHVLHGNARRTSHPSARALVSHL